MTNIDRGGEHNFGERKKMVEEAEQKIIGNAYRGLISKVKNYTSTEDDKKTHILFVGERGTGKELFADLYIAVNPREGNICKVNCAQYPDTLIDSHIFGAKAGAYTDQKKDQKGLVETFNGGFIFLDELGKSSQAFQFKLTRFLEYQTYIQLGDSEVKKADIQFVGATNNLGAINLELQDRFQILYVPPLWEHDIPLLAEHFLGGILKIEYLQTLKSRDYSGNVRELEKECKSLKVMKGNIIIDKKISTDFPPNIFDYARFEQEFRCWNNLIQPILQEHKIDHLKYKYQPWDDNWVNKESADMIPKIRFWAMLLANNIWDSPTLTERDDKRYTHGSIKLLRWLRKGIHKEAAMDSNIPDGDTDITDDKITPDELLPKFIHHLRIHIETGTLPYLLKLISKPDQTHKAPTKPPLSHLLDLPRTEAEKEFKKIWFSYQLANGRDMGIKEKSITQKKERYGMKK